MIFGKFILIKKQDLITFETDVFLFQMKMLETQVLLRPR